ncbi:ABC transporter permease [bacterium]|nr:ABC transporter permease [bacterium]
MTGIERKIEKPLILLAEYFELSVKAFCRLFVAPTYTEEVLSNMMEIGVRSIVIVLLTSFFTGMVLALQTGRELAVYGAKMYVGTVVAVAMLRELGPVLTALVIAGRVGAGITAEIGSMNVTEQIDAMRAMATDPVKRLVSTRMLAGFIVIPALAVFSVFSGIFGGLFVAISSLGVTAPFYWKTVRVALTLNDILAGLVKPFVFGVIIITVACFLGLNTTGGTEGVGRATRASVVVSSILVIVGDFFVTKLLFIILG